MDLEEKNETEKIALTIKSDRATGPTQNLRKSTSLIRWQTVTS